MMWMGILTRRLLVLSVLILNAAAAGAQPEPEVLLKAQRVGEPARPDFAEKPFQDTRAAMVSEQIESRGVTDPRVLEVMRRVPRHRFVPEVDPERAYADSPHPIGHGQTISQPYIVAYMTALLELEPDDRVLEVGTGSAYQAAVLAELVGQVITLEIIRPLAGEAARRPNGHPGWPGRLDPEPAPGEKGRRG